ncbi:signal transduction protein [Streptomyces sp. Ru71]|uniref:EF-hand domain-containing protein n=1 Tax=Streptomyces sp. Ru71 TaxID=2080746 RepID=UPI000CDDA4DF|nr:EF-hand domain-containing protein [Streptomyces sp. Ru71]POX49320.1 signal transduction protein [Streptomyces sp. Ru71]
MSTAVANDRLVKRFEKWDIDGNGVLEPSDFRGEAARIVQNLGKDAGSPEAHSLAAAFQGLYEHLAHRAGVPAGSSITQEQFLAATGTLLFQEGEASFQRALAPVVDALIELCDDNHDGQIDEREFKAWLTAVGAPTSQVGEAFRKVDANGDGVLSRDELLNVVRDFHFGGLQVELLG